MKLIEKYNILSLLPYSEESQLINKHQKLDDLYFIKSVTDISLMALENFIEGNLTLFDAQVGENLCQIRAYKILYLGSKYLISNQSKALLSKEISIFKKYKNNLEEVIIEWESVIANAFSYNKNLDGREFINNFLDRHNLHLDLSEDVVFIISCFFLTHFSIRDNGIPAAINLNFISRELHISKYRSKRLTHKYQLIVCQLGCDFVIKIADDLPLEQGYSTVLSKLYQISDEDRVVLPCYIASEVVFHHAISKKKPVIFIINRINSNGDIDAVIYFTLIGHDSGLGFSLVSGDAHLEQYCIVVFGVVYLSEDNRYSLNNYINRIVTETPLKLILANTASHPQYSGKRLEKFKVNPFLIITDSSGQEVKSYYEGKLLNMQIFAMHNGCSKENPTTFLLKHVYASTVANEINRLEKTYRGHVHSAYHSI